MSRQSPEGTIALQTPISLRPKRPIHHEAIPQLRLEYPRSNPDDAWFGVVMGRGPGHPEGHTRLRGHLRQAEQAVGLPLLNMLDAFVLNRLSVPRPFPVAVRAPELSYDLARTPLVGELRQFTDDIGMQPWQLEYVGDHTWEAGAPDQTIRTDAQDLLLSAQSGRAELTPLELPARHIVAAGLRLVLASELSRLG